MGNVNSLIVAENLSFSLKNKVVTVKTIGSLAMTIVDVRRMYQSKREMLMMLLEHRRAKKEAEVVAVVERCLCLIRERLKDFFENDKKKIHLYAMQVVYTNSKIDNKELFQEVLREEKLRNLQMELKNEIQQEIQLLFNVKSLTLAGSKSSLDELVDHLNINVLLSEYQKTIFVAKHMTTVANTLWDQCLDTLKIPNIIKKVIKKFPLGSMFIKTTNCQPENQLMSCQREIEKYLTGVMMNVEYRIHQEMSDTVVRVFYGLYDQAIASYFDQRLALLENSDNTAVRRKKFLYIC